MKRFIPPDGERGAALLTVLLLVAVMGALAAVALERMRLATALALNTVAIDQARHYAIGVEGLMLLTMNDLLAASPDATTLAGGWQDQVRQVPLPGGRLATARVKDGGNCFNLNSLASAPSEGADLVTNPSATRQFANLLMILEVPQGIAVRIADSAADWIDSDNTPNPQGAEDDFYQQGSAPYRAANAPMAGPSEVRAVAGMTAEIYARIRPYLCALTTNDLSPINVNTLTPDQAPLLAMLAPAGIPVDTARGIIAGRSATGWSNAAEFWTQTGLQGAGVPSDILNQPQVKTQWFALDLDVRLGEAELRETALVDARKQPARVIARRWGDDE